MKKILSKFFICFLALFVVLGVCGCKNTPEDLTILFESDNDMINNYSLIAVDSEDFDRNSLPSNLQV